MPDNRTWFVYQRTAGRITGRPASWQGWLAMLVAIALPVLVAVPLMGRLIRAGRPLLGSLVLAVLLLSSIFLLVRLMLAKGHRIE